MQAFVKLLTIYDFDIKIANVVVVGGGGVKWYLGVTFF